jgi:prepilin-type N-terminal cleavage/methylation domain-containing protein
MARSRRRWQRTRGRPRRGFTLLEVLGAVLVLAMLYSVLAEVAIQGLRAEGESRRRLEASLFADELFTDIEASIEAGDLPPLGVSTEEEDPYIIELEVLPVDTRSLFPPGLLGEGETLASMLGSETEESPLREIVLRISWSEGDRELSVTRTTLGMSAPQFAALPGVGLSDVAGLPAGGGEIPGGGAIAGGGGAADGGAAADRGAGRTGGLNEVQKARRRWEKSGRLDDLLRRREERRRRNQNP